MTCIVGIEDQDGVHLAGDSAGVSGWSMTVRSDEKVFTRDGYALGFTTSFRMGQLLRYSAHLPTLDTWDIDAFMVTRFVPAVRTCLKDGGWLAADRERVDAGTFLVGLAGRLYVVYSDLQVARSANGYAAVGCGQDLALGALHATRDKSTAERLQAALEAAAHHSAGVTGPFHEAHVGRHA